MLGLRHHALALDTVNLGSPHFTRQDGVFAERVPASPKRKIPQDIDKRFQRYIDA
jgi:hypothetical protein